MADTADRIRLGRAKNKKSRKIADTADRIQLERIQIGNPEKWRIQAGRAQLKGLRERILKNGGYKLGIHADRIQLAAVLKREVCG